MPNYYVNANAQPSGDNEVHTDECPFFNRIITPIRLGRYATCQQAVQRAIDMGYRRADGCARCSPNCHRH